MHQILDTSMPEFCVYQYMAGVEVACSKNISMRHWMYDNYINFSCNVKRTNEHGNISIVLPKSTIEFDKPFIECIKINKKEILYSVSEKITHCINNGYYFYVRGIDDFYIKGKINYNTAHMNHDGMIYGYNTETCTYNLMAYDENANFGFFEISMHDFNKAWHSDFFKNENPVLWALKPNKKTYMSKIQNIKVGLYNYIKSLPQTDEPNIDVDGNDMCHSIYGISVYDIIIDSINNQPSLLNNHVFRMLWEHKKFMKKRLEFLNSNPNIDLSKAIDLYTEIVDKFNMLRFLYIKFTITGNYDILEKIATYISILKSKECSILEKVLEEI